MAATTSPTQWVFTQVQSGKQIVLSGATAPHGRPRKGTLLADGVELRDAETYYDGSDSAPTRHIFGSKNTDVELHGRFMDKDLGVGGANALADQWKTWLRDAQDATIEWGDYVSLQGILKSFVPHRESAQEIAYTMTWKISVDTTTPPTPVINRPTLSSDLTAGLTDSIAGLAKLQAPSGFSLNFGFLDAIEDAVDDVQAFTGQFVNLANQIASLETATASQLNRLRASIGQVRTSLTVLQQTLDATTDDFALSRDAANSTVAWGAYRSQTSVDLLAGQAIASQTDRQIAVAQRGRATTSTTAQDGDTWERISIKMFGSPAKADLLRQANGARYGKLPVGGAKIQVPLRM